MTIPTRSRSAEDENHRGPSDADKIQLWQHFVRTAGDDKNKMITITFWLLALSAGVIGYLVTQPLDAERRYLLSVLGVLISIFASYIVWLYSAHEKWNRSKAESLVEQEPALKVLLPPGDRPRGGAWVFGFFLVLTICSLIVHVIVAIYPPPPHTAARKSVSVSIPPAVRALMGVNVRRHKILRVTNA